MTTLAGRRTGRSTHPATTAALLVLPLLGCTESNSADQVLHSLTGPTMGTRYSIRFVKPAPGRAVSDEPSAALQQRIDELLDRINRQMSTYDPASELSRFNEQQDTNWFAVSRETAVVASFAKDLATRSEGAFDPTVGPAVNLWGFGPDGRRLAPPSDADVEAALRRIGHEHFRVRLDMPALKKSLPELQLDFSAIAKGYAVDAVADLLRSLNVNAFMVEIGGEVRTRGQKPDGKPWRIGVEKPDARMRSLQLVLQLNDAALATSGDYRNLFEYERVRYSHTIDPATARPVTHSLAAVSVLAPTCMEADALATALLVMGPAKGYDWAQAHQVAAFFLSRDNNTIKERSTGAWRDYTARGQQPETNHDIHEKHEND